MSWPAYLETYESGELARRVEEAVESLRSCKVCPRDCEVDRLADEAKVCRVGRRAKVSTSFPHFGEEDCLRGWNGSGTIFFSWCNLKCVFCQNWDTSNEGEGREVSAQQLAGMMLHLQGQGCHNINFVSPEHVAPQVLEALPLAIARGLRVPSSTTRAPTTRCTRCGCSTASSTSTCRTSSTGRPARARAT
ncbi:MAG: hypothetical protein M5U28_24245 [Sandaracinaceae bacterium]|nr:hypothetical protein [Sandaracinaceae bacterium]